MEIGGIRLPRNFHTYGRNNHETWKPALTLEEPDDPSRVCHYAKQLVYPPGAGVEYSPEELLARKYMPRLEEQRKQQQQKAQPEEEEELKKEPAIQQQQQLYDSYESGNSYYMTAVNGEVYAQNEDEAEEDEQEEDEEEDDDVEREQLSEQSEEEEDESDGEESEQQDDEQPKQTPSYTNGIAVVDMQFKAQTTFDQNRSIKMKFKKERTLESSTYSAYTIESIYHHHHQQQQPPLSHELPSPAAVVTVPTAPTPPPRTQDWSGGGASVQRQRNGGNHFHPYLLGQTSTPKSALSDGRRARVKAKLNTKFQPELCSNSNSSSSAAAAAANGVETAASAPADRDANPPPIAPTIHNATFNDNANFSFSSAGGLDNSNSSLAMAVGRLHFRDASQVSPNVKSLHPHNNNNNNINTTITTTPASLAEFSTFQENSYFATQHDIEAQERRLSKALETIERHFAKEAIDPFNSELCRAFLAKINFPGDDGDAHASYKVVQTPLPKISNTRTLNVLESVQFNIDKEVGRGSYGSVYKATDTQTGNVVALKYQKPPNTWEIYICDQVS